MTGSSAGSLAMSRLSQDRRREAHEADRHVQRIVARVRELYPRDPSAQRRMLARWSRLLSACDPGVAAALLEVPVSAGRKVA